MKIKNIVTILLIAVILASCAPAAKVIPTETVIPTSAFTPIPPTIEPSPTVELSLEQQSATIEAAELLAIAISQTGTSITYEQILQQGLTVIQKEGFDPADTTGMKKIKYEIAYTQDNFPLMIKMEGENWKSANFENNPYGIIFGYTDRIDRKSPGISSKPFSKLFNANAIYTSNHFSPLRNLQKTAEYNGEPASQPSFFVDGVVEVKELERFINATDTKFKGIVFQGGGIDQMPKDNPNMYVMTVSGQNQINIKFDKMDSVLVEEAFVWYLTNTTKAAINNDVNIFAFNELIRGDNYWVKAMRKTPEQITELAIQTVRLVARENPNLRFMLNDDHIDKPEKTNLGVILKIIQDFDKKGIVRLNEFIIGVHYHHDTNYDVSNLTNAIEKLYAAGIRDIRLTEVDIMGKQEPTDEQILKYYISLIKVIKEQKTAHPDLNISVVFFDEAWENSYLGKNSRITDIPNGLYQLIAELYK
jgi:hypothetical protein